MTKLKHTIGLISLSKAENSAYIKAENSKRIYLGVVYNMETEEGRANAILYIASPELVEALIDTNLQLSKVIDIHSCGELESMLMPIFKNNCEKLKKATGLSWEEIIKENNQ